MTLKFFIVPGKNKNSTIYVRFADSKRIDQKIKTGITVLINDWSESKQRLKLKTTTTQKDFINFTLNQLERYIVDNYTLQSNSKQYISKSWLKEQVAAFFGRVEIDENYKISFV